MHTQFVHQFQMVFLTCLVTQTTGLLRKCTTITNVSSYYTSILLLECFGENNSIVLNPPCRLPLSDLAIWAHRH